LQTLARNASIAASSPLNTFR